MTTMTPTANPNDILQTAESLRWEIGPEFHEKLIEGIYTEAAQLADRTAYIDAVMSNLSVVPSPSAKGGS